jgi:membrane protein
MREFWAHLRRAIFRVVPAALTQAQAIAFVMFLSFFPVMLLSLGLLSLSGWSADPARELPASFQLVLPAGSFRLISEFLEKLQGTPWKLISLGLLGTFLFVTQAMANYVDGFAIVWQDQQKPSYWGRYGRAFKMVCLTIVPWLLTGILTVFGRELRAFLAYFFGGGLLVRIVWAVVYDGAALATAFMALIVMYHVARPHRRWRDQVPGALLATICWWLLTAGFSLYVRNMHYNLIYGSMAAVIGLMIWMYFVALVVMVGAAYNAVAATDDVNGESGNGRQRPAARHAVAATRH